MGDQLRFVDDSGDTRLAGELVDDGATAGDVLTVQSDGSLAAAAGGGSSSFTTPVTVESGVDETQLTVQTPSAADANIATLTDADGHGLEVSPNSVAVTLRNVAGNHFDVINNDEGISILHAQVGGPTTIEADGAHSSLALLYPVGYTGDVFTVGPGGSVRTVVAVDHAILPSVSVAPDTSFVPSGKLEVYDDNGDLALQVSQDGSDNGTVGFFGATPVGRQATPTTLADVIAILQAFGLCS